MVSKDGVSAVPGQIAMDRGGRTELHVRAQVIHLDTNQMKHLFVDSLIRYGLRHWSYPSLAIVAASTGNSRLYSHSVSHLEILSNLTKESGLELEFNKE